MDVKFESAAEFLTEVLAEEAGLVGWVHFHLAKEIVPEHACQSRFSMIRMFHPN